MGKNTSHTLLERIVQDTLSGLARVTKEPPMLHGAIAAQAYLPRRQHRPTRDVDFITLQHITYHEFTQALAPAIQRLEAKGYAVQTIKGRRMHCLIVENEYEEFKVQMPRRSKNDDAFWERNHIAHRNARTYRTVEGSLLVTSPEDLILSKLQRVYFHQDTHGLQPRPWSYNEQKLLGTIKSFRAPIVRSFEEDTIEYTDHVKRLIATIKMQTDLHDIISMLKHADIDWQGLYEAIPSYPTLRGREHDAVRLLRKLYCPRNKDEIPADFFVTSQANG